MKPNWVTVLLFTLASVYTTAAATQQYFWPAPDTPTAARYVFTLMLGIGFFGLGMNSARLDSAHASLEAAKKNFDATNAQISKGIADAERQLKEIRESNAAVRLEYDIQKKGTDENAHK